MKNLLSVSGILIILGVISITACKKSSPPVGCFAAIPDSAFVAQPISFISCTKGANSYLWNFGDGSTAATDSVVHTYTSAGIYHGSLTTSNGQSSTKTFTITVTNNPLGYFTFGSNTFFPANYDSIYQSELQFNVFSDSTGIAFGFNPSLPHTSGQYYISGSPYIGGVLPGQVDIACSPRPNTLYSSSYSNANKQLTVTLLPGGLLNLTATNVEMVNYYAPHDSMPISFTVTTTH